VIGGGGDSGAGNAHDNLAIGGAVGGSDGDGIPAGTTVPNLPGYPSVSIQEPGCRLWHVPRFSHGVCWVKAIGVDAAAANAVLLWKLEYIAVALKLCNAISSDL